MKTKAAPPKAAPRKRRPAYKSVLHDGEVQGAVADAFSEIESLAEEMRETAENMEAGGMGHLDKCVAATEAADTLENISQVEAPDGVADLPMKYSISVPTRKGRGTGRSTRLSNACSMLQQVIDMVQEEDLVEEVASDHRDDFVTELETVISEIEGVEFPGMYG